MHHNELDLYFSDFSDSPDYIGVHLVRNFVGQQSELFIELGDALELMDERYSPSQNFSGGYYMPITEKAWKQFVWEFFPGWRIHSFIL